MANHYAIRPEVTALFDDFYVNSTSPAIASLRDEGFTFKVVLKTKLNSNDKIIASNSSPVKVKKISGLYELFIAEDYLLIVDESAWITQDTKDRKDMFKAALMSIPRQSEEESTPSATSGGDFDEDSLQPFVRSRRTTVLVHSEED